MAKTSKLTPIVYLVLFKDDRVLLSLRKNDVQTGSNYSFIYVYITDGEAPEDSLIEEVKNEIGLSIEKDDLKRALVIHRHPHILELFFTVKKWEGEIINLEPEFCENLNFFSPYDFPDNIDPVVEECIEALKKGKSYIKQGF